MSTLGLTECVLPVTGMLGHYGTEKATLDTEAVPRYRAGVWGPGALASSSSAGCAFPGKGPPCQHVSSAQ